MGEFRSRRMQCFVGALFAALIVFAAWRGTGWAAEAPVFWISNLDGQRFDSRAHQGTIVVSFFFTTCVPCIKEIPELYRLVTTKYPKTALLFIDPLAEDSVQAIEAFAQRLNVPQKYFYADPLGRLAKKFFTGQYAFPTIVGMKGRSLLFKVAGLPPGALETIEKSLR
ncbi:MAG: TlpA family protein disulfide reductase [Candidatus Lambdaproteobacteria bacterium]|nr:TlpA family protein disulfide reductase [Candidatus Lambdaproteobacteria bacterium]